MNLLDKAIKATPPVTKGWVKYKEVYFQLLDNGFEPMQASRWIAKEEKLTAEEETKLYNTSKQWKR